MIYGVTKSKIVGIFTSIVISSSVGGVEPASFLGANNVTFFIIPLTLGIYFWMKSINGFISNRNTYISKLLFIAALVILTICAKGEVWSYYLIPTVTIYWGVIQILLYRDKKILKIFITSILILLSLLLIVSKMPPNPNWYQRNNGINKLKSIKVENSKNLFSSIGNLVGGSFVYLPEGAGTSAPSVITKYLGLNLITLFFLTGLIFLINKKEKIGIINFFLFWILIFYLPNWIFESQLTVGATHRYLTIPSIGFYGLIVYFAHLIFRNKTFYILIIFIIVNGIYLSNKHLEKLNFYRSYQKTNMVIDSINSSIKNFNDDTVISYSGEGGLSGYLLDWSLGIPIAMKRNISDRTEFPIWGMSLENAQKYYCGIPYPINLVGKGDAYYKKGNNLSIDDFYYFDVKDSGEVIDKSQEFRSNIILNANCTKNDL
jgi:hypothetical protein